jgi:AcrR family transcriptional regulator
MKSHISGQKPRTRRKEARPTEIKSAALEVFAERGFDGASIDAIAARAGVVAGSIYRYYLNKEDLFRAAVDFAADPAMQIEDSDTVALVDRVASGATALSQPHVLLMARLLLTESRNFPDLARDWYSKVFSPILDSVVDSIKCAQTRGDIRSGDPNLQAFSLLAPLFMAALFQTSFSTDSGGLPDQSVLMKEHMTMAMHGLRTQNSDAMV